jgi:hypothetical protein
MSSHLQATIPSTLMVASGPTGWAGSWCLVCPDPAGDVCMEHTAQGEGYGLGAGGTTGREVKGKRQDLEA